MFRQLMVASLVGLGSLMVANVGYASELAVPARGASALEARELKLDETMGADLLAVCGGEGNAPAIDDPCPFIQSLEVTCDLERRWLKATVESDLPPCTRLRLVADDVFYHDARVWWWGQARAWWRNPMPGEHEVCIEGCNLCATTVCGCASDEDCDDGQACDPETGHCHELYIDEGMVLISGGEFEMGCHAETGESCDSDELPVHVVYIDSFYMDAYEVTNEQYCEYLNDAYPSQITVVDDLVYAADDTDHAYPLCKTFPVDSRSRIHFSDGMFTITFEKEEHPMVSVSWYGAVAYANWRSARDGREPCYDPTTWECDVGATGYRLPTEAEWEYGARGGEHSPYYMYPWGNDIDGSKANYWNSGDPDGTGYPQTTPIGYYDGNQTPPGVDMPNGYGLYDMAGNVWEWCNDWYDASYYNSSSIDNPHGPVTGTQRVLRGGSWGSLVGGDVRCAARGKENPYVSAQRNDQHGFRLVLEQ